MRNLAKIFMSLFCAKMWNKLLCKKSELQLHYTLCGGQCFRWEKHGSSIWRGVFAHRVWELSQDENYIFYKVYANDIHNEKKGKSARLEKSSHENEEERLLRKYFHLDVSLHNYYADWGHRDPYFKEAALGFPGVRILAQDPVENIFSFICSSNNNITRISSMVQKLCALYGKKLIDIDGTPYYDFPEVASLTGPLVEQTLRKAGFGYRAKFISQSAQKIQEFGGSKWLQILGELQYQEAKLELMKLPGIGAKVADCICLMSLGHLGAIPVDTHVFQIAVKCYLPHLAGRKTVTDKIYNEIVQHFQSLYGPLAGWAHTVLFCADLKMFQQPATTKATKVEAISENKTGAKRKKKS